MTNKLTRAEAEEQALKVWKIIEDAVGYGFNSSHAYSVALDSLYGAWLKATYPLEYFSVVLNIYKDDKDKQSELINELGYFGIKLKGLEFGKSQADYSYDKETNTIYKGISTIAYLNSKVSENLYNLSQEKQYTSENVVDLFVDIIEGKLADNRQINILTKLGFFSQFGKETVLLELYNTMTGYQKKKTNLIFTNNEKLDVKYSKSHKEATKRARIYNAQEYYILIQKNQAMLPETLLFDRLMTEVEYMGYMTTTDQTVSKDTYVIIEVNTKYTPVYKLYNLFDGHIEIAKVEKSKAYKNTETTKDGKLVLNVGDTIEILEFGEKPKMSMVDGKWEKNYNQMQKYIDHVKMIDRYNN